MRDHTGAAGLVAAPGVAPGAVYAVPAWRGSVHVSAAQNLHVSQADAELRLTGRLGLA